MASLPPQSSDESRDAALQLQLGQMIGGYRLSQVIHVAATFGVADHLADGPQTSAVLAQRIPAHPDALYRLLRACAGFGLFTEVAPRTFALTPLGALLQSNVTGSLRDQAVAMAGPGHWLPWGQLAHAIRSGQPTVTEVLGSDLFDYYAQHEEEGTHFARAMGYITATTAAAVVASYDASQATKIVDVGGSHGVLLAALLQAAPTAHGVLFDLPHVLPEAREVVKRLGLQDRIELVGGDCFQEVPPGGDLYLLKQMLECWEDARCTRLLENITRVAKPHGTLLVIERLLPDTPAPSPVFLADLTMLVLAGGRERSRQEFATLLSSAGYHIERIIPTSGPFSVIEATRGS
jgi:hypothetical protein